MTDTQADAVVRGVPTNVVLTDHKDDPDAAKVAIFDALARRAAAKLERRAAKGAD